jgi:hypothetical protein
MTLLLPGYPGVIWNAMRATIEYGTANLDATEPVSTKALAEGIVATLRNGVHVIDAYEMMTGLQTLYANLSPLLILPIVLDGPTQAFVVNRLTAIQQAALGAADLLVEPLPQVKLATQLQGSHAFIPDPGFVEWQLNSLYEPSPSGSTAALVSDAQACATAWAAVATALKGQGIAFSGTTLNTVELMARITQFVADLVTHMSPMPTMDDTMMWNQLVAMPTFSRLIEGITDDPTSLTAQSTQIIRYVVLNAINTYNELIITLRDISVTSNLRLGTVRMGDRTLLTFAAREINDYSQWQAIAQLNKLQPPYIANVPGPNVVVPGQQLLLPPSNTALVPITPAQATPAISYTANYLGIDRLLGSINQPMLPWQGDYQVIAGYPNLSMALGRRLQTTLGSLIYHSLYGSRIPPELGAIASDVINDLLVEYTISALLTDPRVNQVISCTAQYLGNYSVQVSATVLPNGLGQNEITVNEVIGPV